MKTENGARYKTVRAEDVEAGDVLLTFAGKREILFEIDEASETASGVIKLEFGQWTGTLFAQRGERVLILKARP
jgi:hypothetical protein